MKEQQQPSLIPDRRESSTLRFISPSLSEINGRALLVAFVVVVAAAQVGAEETETLGRWPVATPTPEDNAPTAAKIALGKQLFFDPRLSGDNKMSCATCHLPGQAFTDGVAKAVGAEGRVLPRNTQTILNVAAYPNFFWDGRADSLEQQALIPIAAPSEMNQPLEDLEAELEGVTEYAQRFREIFGSRVTGVGIAKAIASFERSILSEAAPIDRYLAGNKTALSLQAVEGLQLFKGSAGCIRCHNGPLLSDFQFYRIGVSFQDKGKEQVTGLPEDRFRIRTPPLRNIAQTAPYMHDGSLRTLDDVVTYYFRGVPHSSAERTLDVEALASQSFSDIPALVAFLESLTGAVPKIEPPILPD